MARLLADFYEFPASDGKKSGRKTCPGFRWSE